MGALVERLKVFWRRVIPHLFGDGNQTRSQRIARRIRVGIVLAACLVTFQSVLLVVGAWVNDGQIERDMGVAAAEVVFVDPPAEQGGVALVGRGQPAFEWQ